jgi:hypothetical protein
MANAIWLRGKAPGQIVFDTGLSAARPENRTCIVLDAGELVQGTSCRTDDMTINGYWRGSTPLTFQQPSAIRSPLQSERAHGTDRS